MPVIIREKRTISGIEYDNIKVYKTDRPLTREEKEQAEKLDLFLHKKMEQVLNEIKSLNILSLKNKPGVLKLWYEVGKRLSFIEDTSIVPAEDRKYVWRALYDHTDELRPGKINVRASKRPENSHFAYCYYLSKYSWGFVNHAGNWTAWVEFFDSEVIRNDSRIIDWLGSKQPLAKGSVQDWLRKITREIRRNLKNIDTKIFSINDLHDRLEGIFDSVYPDLANRE